MDDHNNLSRIIDTLNTPPDSIIGPTGIDDLALAAAMAVVESQKASIGMLQRKFKLGFNRAARIMDQLCDFGIVCPEEGTKPRRILMTLDQVNDFFENGSICVDGEFISIKEYERWELEERNRRREEVIKQQEKAQKLREKNGLEAFSIMYGFSSDYSAQEDRDFPIDNTLIINANNNTCENIIINIVREFPPAKAQVIYLGDGSIRNYELPHFLLKNDATYQNVSATLSWAWNEVENRKEKFVSGHVKRIEEYNRTVFDIRNRLPAIVIIIDEIAEVITPEFTEALLHILLAGPQFGVTVILASKLSQKSLKLGPCMDMLSVTEPRRFALCRPYNAGHDYEDDQFDSFDNFDNMTGLEFEHFCAELLSRNGFENVEITKGSGDFGGDVIAYKDDIKYAIQCKLYSGPVGIGAVQEVIGSKSIYECHVGAVMTNNKFTPAAIELAKKNLILLWDIDKLRQLMERV